MDDIIQWLTGGKDYAQGVAILGRYAKNAALVRHFQCTTAKFAAAKLEYELRKLLKGRAITSKPVRTAEQTVITTPKSKQPTAVPDTIAQAKNELYELFTAISTAHRKLYELGEGNSEDVVAQRRRILQDRLPLIRRYEKLYLLKEQYFDTGKVPAELSRMIAEKVTEEPEPATTDSRKELEALSDVELMKKQHSLKVNINKTVNRLEYQALKKLDTPNPMPESPLRSKLEAKLANQRQQYTLVTQILESRK
ncbi:MAG: hypothetical protein IKZ52_09605 [Bacteroidales bacterium]|nr:hypothetical protein [Bacteroidales bacterium]